ncbi:hypothetical protein PROVRETT_05882 [Providencia rettgeri DSM 1131]|nr:hypothetical protein PROVRETT_05882 [Providencia rettgeri DSM 1131]
MLLLAAGFWHFAEPYLFAKHGLKIQNVKKADIIQEILLDK